MAQLVGLVIYDSILFEVGHHVHRWATSVENKLTYWARLEAPINKRANKSRWDAAYPPGSLAASISGDVERIGPKHIQITSSVDVPYATYVLFGTRGPITPTTSPWLYLPRNAGHGRRNRFYYVPGQSANNFYARASGYVEARHPSVRGLREQIFQQW